MKRPTQADVARQAGVSRATVYYVLNKQTAGRAPISEETRQRVLDAVATLGYEPDIRAQALRSGATKRIGLLIPDNSNPFYWQVVMGVEQAAKKQGYDILLFTSSLSEEQETYSLKALSSRRVDGVIVILAFIDQSESMLARFVERRLPVVLIQRTEYDLDTVTGEYADGMRQVMAHLFAMGHRRIGLIYGIGNQSQSFEGGRLQQYCAMLREAGLPVADNLIDRCGTTVEEGYQAANRLLNQASPPTALVALNDLLAIGAVRAAGKKGLQIPGDVSIVGFDDIPLAQYYTPPLTSVHYDTEAVSRLAIKLLLERLQNPDRPIRQIRVPVQLVARASTGPPKMG